MNSLISRIATVTTAAAISFLAGCATAPTGAKLTYETSPAGATLYEGGKSLGIAPQMRGEG